MRRQCFFLYACGLTVLASSLLSPAVRAADSSVASLWQEAEQLRQTEQYAEAADHYRSILASETHWKKRAKAACMGAACLDRAGRSSESIPLLDAAIAEADNLLAQNKPGVDESWTLSALYGKAVACEKAGDKAGALKAIERLRAQFFKSDQARQAIQIRARLEAWSEQQLAQTLTREQEAMDLAEQAAAAFHQKQHPQALEICDRILQQYADTAAVYPALRTKALTLWNDGRYRQAKAVYQMILDRLRPVAPHSRLAQTAEYRVAWLDAGQMSKDFLLRRRKGMPPTDAEWQHLRDRCQVILTLDPDPVQRADATVMMVQSCCWQGRSEDALQVAEGFLRQQEGGKKLAKFGYQAAWVRLFASVAATNLGRYQESTLHYEQAFSYASQCPDARLRDAILDAAHVARWHAMERSGASAEQLLQLAQEHVAQLPNTTSASQMRGYIQQQEQEQSTQSEAPVTPP